MKKPISDLTPEEAITCYLIYGEYSRAGIMREVRAAYASAEKEAYK